MAMINYYSTPDGGRQVDVPGVEGSSYPGGGAGGPGMDLSWLTAFAKRNAANKLAQQELDYQQDRESTRKHKGSKVKGVPVDPMEAALKSETIRTEIAKQQAMRGRMPTRTSYGPGYIAPNQPDIPKMNSFQRQLFLPQGNSFTGPSLSEQDAGFRESGLGLGRFVESEGGLPARQDAASARLAGPGTAHGMNRASSRERAIAGLEPAQNRSNDDDEDDRGRAVAYRKGQNSQKSGRR